MWNIICTSGTTPISALNKLIPFLSLHNWWEHVCTLQLPPQWRALLVKPTAGRLVKAVQYRVRCSLAWIEQIQPTLSHPTPFMLISFHLPLTCAYVLQVACARQIFPSNFLILFLFLSHNYELRWNWRKPKIQPVKRLL